MAWLRTRVGPLAALACLRTCCGAPRYTYCFPDAGSGVNAEKCCGKAGTRFSTECFVDEVYTWAECCRGGGGFAMVLPDTPPEPVQDPGHPGARTRSSHPAYSDVQAEWERVMRVSTRTQRAKLGRPEQPMLDFRHWKVDRYNVPFILKELLGDEYGLDLSQNKLAPGDVVLDIGANVGAAAITLASRFAGVRIVAVEPDPMNFRYLLWNLKANNVSDSVWPINAGICSSEEGENITYTVPLLDDRGPIQIFRSDVACLSLERLFELFGLDRVSLLKVDCEGCEFPLVASSSARALLQKVGRITGEVHNHFMAGAMIAGGVSPELNRLTREIFCRPGNKVTGCDVLMKPIPL